MSVNYHPIKVPKKLYDEAWKLKRSIFREQGLKMPMYKAVSIVENRNNKRDDDFL